MPPVWLELRRHLESPFDASLELLDDGEKAALELAVSLAADLVLMDDRAGVRAARNIGFRVAGTLRVLDLAARRGLLDLPMHLSASNGRVSLSPTSHGCAAGGSVQRSVKWLTVTV